MGRIHKNKADYGMSDYCTFYRKEYNNKINRSLYNNIITDFNDSVRKLIINEELNFYAPYIGIELSIRKDKRKPRIVDGKLINNIPVDWKATNELWNKDSEAKEKKLLVRYNNSHTSGYVYRLYLNKFKSKMRNKNYFKFRTNRIFQRMLSKRIKDPNKEMFDSFLLY